MTIVDDCYNYSLLSSKKLVKSLAYCSWGNPVDWVTDKGIKNSEKRKDSPNILNAYFGEIERSFDLLCASPTRAELFDIGYKFPDKNKLDASQLDQVVKYEMDNDVYMQDILKGEEDVYANINKDLVGVFVSSLSMLAKMGRSGTSNRRYHKVIFLTGSMGEGKTIFINYLLSVHMRQFESEGVLPVKIDLTDRDVDATDSVSDLIYRKYALVLLEHYVGKQISVENVLSVARESGARDGFQQLIRSLMSDIGSKGLGASSLDSIFSDRLRIRKIFNILRVAAKKVGFSTLLIVDGLDNFHRDMVSREKFIRRSQEVLRYSRLIDKLEVAYVLVSREESYNYIKGRNEGRGQSHKLRNVRLLNVAPCDILDVKGKLAQKLLRDLHCGEDVGGRRQEEIEGYGKEKRETAIKLIDYISPMADLVVDMINRAFMFDPEEGRRLVLDKVFESNNRAIQDSFVRVLKDVLNRLEIIAGRNFADGNKALSHLVTEYVVNLFEGDDKKREFVRRYSYIVIDSLMINKMFLCMPRFKAGKADSQENPFSMVLPGEGREKVNLGPVAAHDIWSRTLIPNVYDVSSFRKYEGKISGCAHYLSQIRILQYLEYAERSGMENPKYIQIASALGKYFGYDPNVIRTELRMLYANQCVKVLESDNPDNPGWMLSPLGQHMVNGLMYRYAYMVNAVDFVVLPESFVAKFLSPSVSLVLHENSLRHNFSEYRSSFGKTLSKKMSYALAFAALLEHIDDLEYARYKKYNASNCFSFDPFAEEDDLRIGARLRESVTGTANLIYRGGSEFIQNSVHPNFYIRCKEMGVNVDSIY